MTTYLYSMINISSTTLKKVSLILSVFIVLFSCKKDQPLSFTEQTIEKTQNAMITINYPKAEGDDAIADRINKTIENFLANEINMSEKLDSKLSLDEAVKGFDDEFKSFKEDFSDSAQQWEVSVESEVNYETDSFICITVNSYLDTGGAHGNSRVTFLNFDKKTGNLLKRYDILKDETDFKAIVKPYFDKATKPLSDDEAVQDMFFGEDFQLPENIGFNAKGVILLYNVYEIATYAQGVTEFTIPYSEAKPFLKIKLE